MPSAVYPPPSTCAPLVVIVGETASGKSAAAMEVAREFNGEIICADSRTIYKGMDIATAKPSLADRQEIPHHLLDVVTPDQSFSAADFKRLAEQAIADIDARGKLPILVGGSGLYIDAVLYNFEFGPPADLVERALLNELSVESLQARLTEMDIAIPRNKQNKVHLVRAIERKGVVPRRNSLRANTWLFGMTNERASLRQRLGWRIELMVDMGLVNEIKFLASQYGWDAPGLSAPGYKAFREYIEGSINLEQAKAQFIKNDYALAKRQATWFRRNPSIQWVNGTSEIVDLITTLLNK